MHKFLMFIPEFITSFFLSVTVSYKVLEESVNYLILSILILVIRLLSAKIEKQIEKYNKNKKNDE